jgi:glycylpeptide N-tetradecanoyltransferase
VPQVCKLLNEHLHAHYKVHISFDEKEVEHWLSPRKGIFYSYVVEDDKGKITDLLSYYALNSHVLNHEKYDKINIAYASYCVAQGNDDQRLKRLFKDALILARKDDFDVFNVTEVMQHKKVLEDLMFKLGDGKLHHYLYNWKVPACEPEDIGIILM